MPSTRATHQKIEVLRAAPFADLAWLRHGFSTRLGGVSPCYGGNALNLGITEEDTRENVQQNRELFFREIGAVGNPALAKPAGVGHPEIGEVGGKTKGPSTRANEHPMTRKPGASWGPRSALARDDKAARDDREIWPSVAMKQIHSSIVHLFPAATGNGPHPQLSGDGLITREPGTVLTVRTADCVPVLIVDPEERAVGTFHAGWRGTLARIVEKGVGEMRRCFGSRAENLRAAIGPGIRRCCYEVSEELKEKFSSQFAYADDLFEEVFSSDPVREKYPLLFLNMRAPGHGAPPATVHLDLIEANRRQLLDAGVKAENIWDSGLCTSCRTDLFFSHRKEHGHTGRMMAAVAIAP